MTRSRRYAIGALLCLVTATLDQASKTWLIAYMAGQPPSGVTVTSFFDLVMVWNYGVSFGLFNNGSDGQTWVLIGVAAGVVLLLVAWLGRVERAWLAAAIGAVIGGAVGNVVDRLRFGAVADFFSFHVFGYYWPAFNLADSAIVCGVGLLLLDAMLTNRAGH